jgi:hypothetical protein
MRFALICMTIAAAFVVSCTESIVMKHRDGRVATCGPYALGMTMGDDTAVAMREAKCIDDFKAQGFVRQPS